MPIYHFKILVPAAAAGRIIGKGGITIAQLQKDAGARVKMSKASEFYPGTTERVCLISGPIEGILKINDFFMENFNSSTSMKILVPNSTAGMIIGKGGSYIKQIKEESGAYVQISQKCTDFSLPERCVTIVGESQSIRVACAMILNKIVEDSAGGSPASITASALSSAPSALPTCSLTSPTAAALALSSSTLSSSPFSAAPSSPFASEHPLTSSAAVAAAAAAAMALRDSTGDHSRSSSITNPAAAAFLTSSTSSSASSVSASASPQPAAGSFSLPASPASISTSATATTLQHSTSSSHLSAFSASPLSQHSTSDHPQIIETIKMVLQVSGYGEDAVSEISSAMSTLANYGVLGVGLGLF